MQMGKILLIVVPILILVNNYSSAQSTRSYIKTSRNGFIENKGQIRDQYHKQNTKVKYLLRMGNGENLQLTNKGFSYDTYTSDDTIMAGHNLRTKKFSSADVKSRKAKSHLFFHRVDVSLLNADTFATMLAENPFDFYTNYNSSKERKTFKILSYSRITYKNIYPNIDLVFDCSKSDSTSPVEYFFVVKPGGDARRILLKYEGANSTRLHENQIEISVTRGTWKERIPESFTDTCHTFRPQKTALAKVISVRYTQTASDTYGFSVGNYDHNQTLVIDPTPDLIYGTYYGGELNDWGYGISKDSSGNIFIGGATQNTDDIATSGAYKTEMDDSQDAILGKFTKDGQPVWVTYYGGSEEDEIFGLTIDHNNNVIAVGTTFSSDNIATPGSHQSVNISYEGASSAFLIKFANDGELVWGTYYGGDSITWGTGVAIDELNNIYVSAWTTSAVGIATPGAFKQAYSGGVGTDAQDGCIAKFDGNGNLLWGTYFGDNSFDGCYAIAVDHSSNVYVTGITYSQQNIATGGSHQTVFGGGASDAFIAKFNTDGTRQWASYYGGSGDDYGESVCIDSKDNVYFCGQTSSVTGISTPGSQQPVLGGDYDGFFAKFNPNGNFLSGSYFGGIHQEYTTGITTDDQDNLIICGGSWSDNGLATAGSYQPQTADGNWTPFVSLLNSAGILQWGTYYGNTSDYPYGEAEAVTASKGYVYITGETTYSNNVATCDAYQKNFAGNQDVFLAKFGTILPQDLPSVSIVSQQGDTVCKNSLVAFNGNVKNMGPLYNYQWLLNGNPVGTNDSFYLNNQLGEGDAVMAVVQKEGACAGIPYNSNTIIMQIDPGLPPSITITGPTDSLCKGQKVIFTSDISNGGSFPFYQWSVNNNPSGGDSAAFVTNSLVNGDVVSCTLTHGGSCIIDSTSGSNKILVNVKSVPVPSINISSSADPVCSGNAVTFVADVSNAGIQPIFQWEYNGTSVGTDSVSFTSNDLKDGDEVICMVTANSSGCSSLPYSSNIITENVLITPLITITGDSVITKGKSSQLSANVVGNVNGYQWEPAGTLNSATISNPIATPLQSTTYSLAVTGADGCAAKKMFTIEVLTKIEIPNAFTPNGDGINDVFRPLYGSDISQVVFTIYNRWGQLLFQDKGTHSGWDGTFESKPLESGAYVWEFSYKTSDNQIKILKGAVLLIR
jgi:gliding motility-associated-like protein